MAKIKRVIRCFHCGVTLQDEDPNAKGYIPSDILNDEYRVKETVVYCEDCYQTMKSINNGELNQNVDEEILKILDDARATDALVVYVIDLFTFNGTIKKSLADKIKHLKVAVLATKRDLLPGKIKDEDLEEYIRNRFNEAGIDPIYIRILEPKREEIYKEILEKGMTSRRGHDIYVIGDLTSGKTTIINKCLKYYVNKTRRTIKTENYSGTNVKVLSIPLSNSTFMFELPGLALDVSVVGKVEKDVQKVIIPKKAVKVTSYLLNPSECIAIGSLASFALMKGNPTSFKLYTAELVESKKMAYARLDDFQMQNLTKRGLRPVSERYISFADFDIFEYQMENDGLMHDISIEGLGWISFKAEGQVIRVSLPKGAALKECIAKVK